MNSFLFEKKTVARHQILKKYLNSVKGNSDQNQDLPDNKTFKFSGSPIKKARSNYLSNHYSMGHSSFENNAIEMIKNKFYNLAEKPNRGLGKKYDNDDPNQKQAMMAHAFIDSINQIFKKSNDRDKVNSLSAPFNTNKIIPDPRNTSFFHESKKQPDLKNTKSWTQGSRNMLGLVEIDDDLDNDERVKMRESYNIYDSDTKRMPKSGKLHCVQAGPNSVLCTHDNFTYSLNVPALKQETIEKLITSICSVVEQDSEAGQNGNFVGVNITNNANNPVNPNLPLNEFPEPPFEPSNQVIRINIPIDFDSIPEGINNFSIVAQSNNQEIPQYPHHPNPIFFPVETFTPIQKRLQVRNSQEISKVNPDDPIVYVHKKNRPPRLFKADRRDANKRAKREMGLYCFRRYKSTSRKPSVNDGRTGKCNLPNYVCPQPKPVCPCYPPKKVIPPQTTCPPERPACPTVPPTRCPPLTCREEPHTPLVCNASIRVCVTRECIASTTPRKCRTTACTTMQATTCSPAPPTTPPSATKPPISKKGKKYEEFKKALKRRKKHRKTENSETTVSKNLVPKVLE